MPVLSTIFSRSAALSKLILAIAVACVSASSLARDEAPTLAPNWVKPKLPTQSPRPRSAGATAVCTPAPIGTTGYSEVFKGCHPTNTFLAVYFDKTECVRDNATGKIWQGQTPAGTGLRANNQFKTNFDDITKPQKWVSNNTYVNPTQAEVDAITNSIGFKNAVNVANLCGFNDWRLSTIAELLTIDTTPPNPTQIALYIDSQWFPNTVPNKYWSSDLDLPPLSRAHRGRGHSYVPLSFGESARYYTNDHSVRLVRP